MKKLHAFLLIFLVALMASCNLKTYSGEQTTEKRSAGEYNKIKIKGPFNVTIDPNTTSGLTITAPNDALPDIETKVEGGELILEIDNYGFISPEIEVVIANDQLEAITIAGSGSFIGAVRTNRDLNLIVSGSGTIETEAEADEVNAVISGSGDIMMVGSCKILEASISGSGDMDFSNLEATDADVAVSGSGDMKVNVSDKLEASIAGSGSVEYKGKPEEVEKTVSGSGAVSSF
jgi:hypothetical protein